MVAFPEKTPPARGILRWDPIRVVTHARRHAHDDAQAVEASIVIVGARPAAAGSAPPGRRTRPVSAPAASRKTSPSWRKPTPGTNDQIDAAYREKYRRYSAYVPPMISPEARATTLRLMPRSTSS
jgi:Uncharacterized protein conserved in bacteria (DUF2255)